MIEFKVSPTVGKKGGNIFKGRYNIGSFRGTFSIVVPWDQKANNLYTSYGMLGGYEEGVPDSKSEEWVNCVYQIRDAINEYIDRQEEKNKGVRTRTRQLPYGSVGFFFYLPKPKSKLVCQAV